LASADTAFTKYRAAVAHNTRAAKARAETVHVGRDGRQTPSGRPAWTPTCRTCSSSWSPSSLWWPRSPDAIT